MFIKWYEAFYHKKMRAAAFECYTTTRLISRWIVRESCLTRETRYYWKLDFTASGKAYQKIMNLTLENALRICKIAGSKQQRMQAS